MSKEEFEKKYCEDSDITLQEYKENFITLRCNCGEQNCLGWACVCNDKLAIKNHMRLYN